MNIKLYLRWAFAYFLMIVLFGTFMRWIYVSSPPFDFKYKYVLHTHSHIALLGWVYTALTALISKNFLSKTSSKGFSWIFWVTQITIVGMLFSFPFQGYGFYSIIFSTLFLFVSFFFAGFFFRKILKEKKSTYSYKWIRASLWYMIISNIAPLGLGYIMARFGKDSPIYNGAIYFYLHFQYNGWMLMAVIGLFLYYIEQKNISLNNKIQKYSLWLFSLGVFLSLTLSWTGLTDVSSFYIVGGTGIILQILSIILITKEVLPKINTLGDKWLLKLICVLFFEKLTMQLLSSIPMVGQATFFNIDIVIGYLHFVFLGVISLSLIYFLLAFKEIKIPKWSIIFFICIFFLTEILIFYKGFSLLFGVSLFNNFFLVLAFASTLFFIPVITFFVKSFKSFDD